MPINFAVQQQGHCGVGSRGHVNVSAGVLQHGGCKKSNSCTGGRHRVHIDQFQKLACGLSHAACEQLRHTLVCSVFNIVELLYTGAMPIQLVVCMCLCEW